MINRNKKIGTKLVKTVEEYFKNKGFDIEFIGENPNNLKLSKYFLVKYIK